MEPIATQQLNSFEEEYLQKVASFHRELQIPEDYGQRGLPFHAASQQLGLGDHDPNGKPMLMAPRTSAKWKEMKAAAAADGIILLLESAFRGLDEQAQIIRNALNKGESLTSALTWIAAPGYSEHHTGRALDIGSPDCFPIPNTDEFEGTNAFAWLRQNASTYGFHMSYPRGNAQGFIFEPWHWCLH
ncbi:MAG: M15 family metallopeptidase [Kiritimatiellae bacterium]|nr:M15 family metallopeptidase [Kiritimatiellia bacterium]